MDESDSDEEETQEEEEKVAESAEPKDEVSSRLQWIRGRLGFN
jgi:hypothetical protein